MLCDFCEISKSEYDDFVGLKFLNGKPKVFFPRGFSLSADEVQNRKDILRLLSTLQKFSDRNEGSANKTFDGVTNVSFPILSYQYIIKDFLLNGYYVEKEPLYKTDTRGKINWKKTVQNCKPIYNNGNVVYLDFFIKTNKTNENNLLTQVHKYCVRESFEKLGWLYLTNDVLPQKSNLKFNKSKFISVLNDALNNTFNKKKRLLFTSMINIINGISEDIDSNYNIAFGVNRFEYVWEKLIDYIFGEDNKAIYFPHATWHIIDKGNSESSSLKPDTIMLYDDKIYILDAKYYKYGMTGVAADLPGSPSIQKQITYGEYIDVNTSFPYQSNNIYNAFIMPFNKIEKDNDNYKVVSVGTADWKEYGPSSENYKYVLGILLDTRYVLESYSKHNFKDIEELSNLIVQSLKSYREKKEK